MESIKKVTNCRVTCNSPRSGYEGSLNFEFNSHRVEDVAGLSYFNNPFDKCNIASTGDGKGTDRTNGLRGSELANSEQRTSTVSSCTEDTQKAGTPQLEKIPLAAMNRLPSDEPESSEREPTTTIARDTAADLPRLTISGGLLACPEVLVELPVVPLPRQHCELQFLGLGMDGEMEDQESMVGGTDIGSGKLIGEAKAHPSGQERGVHHAVQSSSIKSKVKKTNGSEHHANPIPVLRIPDTKFFGNCLRFSEATKSLRTPELRPTLNPFEDIERQGRCSPLNHSRSPPGSRHHSRSSTVGLQAFRPFPSAMKTSKETGDQPPVMPSPPLLPANAENVHDSIRDAEGFGGAVGAELDPSRGPCKSDIEGAFWSNVESLDINDFDIVFASKQKLRPYEGFSGVEMGGRRSFYWSSASNKELCEFNRANLAESACISSRIDQGKVVAEVRRKEFFSSIRPAENTSALSEAKT